MELKHIDIAKLSVSPVNMRGVKKTPDLTNILPSVRARGVLVPLIVRAKPCPEPAEGGSTDTYEIVAGKRRYHAALAVAGEGGGIEELPCAIMEAGDDAAALEASLIENIARLDPDEVTHWETFTRLVREGRSPEDIAITFGLTEVQVKRTLALGNLLPRIRSLYRDEKIDAVTVRHLTLASKTRQREWLALVDDPEARAPVGQTLKAWLFGGASISTKVALFDVAAFEGGIVADLFGEDSYFASVEQFWEAQNAAIAERAEAYGAAGWTNIVTLEPGQFFQSWEHEKRAKRKGGKVYIAIGHRGDVAFHEGYISLKEARKLAKGAGDEAASKPNRPEITAAGNDYVDLHRHAAVRAKLVEAPGTALRVDGRPRHRRRLWLAVDGHGRRRPRRSRSAGHDRVRRIRTTDRCPQPSTGEGHRMKPYVICHMMGPLDGQLLVDEWSPSTGRSSDDLIAEYDRVHEDLACPSAREDAGPRGRASREAVRRTRARR